MGVFDKGAQQADEKLQAVLDPQLAAGETMLGRLIATHSKTFSAIVYGIGVTSQRLIMQPVGRTLEAKGEPITVAPGDVRKSSVDGFGGGLSEFLKSEPGEIRIETADHKFKLAALGGGLDQVFTGDAQRDGKRALIEFLYSARNPSG
jgi:hypothetical protein